MDNFYGDIKSDFRISQIIEGHDFARQTGTDYGSGKFNVLIKSGDLHLLWKNTRTVYLSGNKSGNSPARLILWDAGYSRVGRSLSEATCGVLVLKRGGRLSKELFNRRGKYKDLRIWEKVNVFFGLPLNYPIEDSIDFKKNRTLILIREKGASKNGKTIERRNSV